MEAGSLYKKVSFRAVGAAEAFSPGSGAQAMKATAFPGESFKRDVAKLEDWADPEALCFLLLLLAILRYFKYGNTDKTLKVEGLPQILYCIYVGMTCSLNASSPRSPNFTC